MTKVRTSILGQFLSAKIPLSASDIQMKLSQDGFSTNKTTIYRELSAIRNAGIIKKIMFGDRNERYELAEDDHHHHLVCVSCKKIENIPLMKLEKRLDDEEFLISKKNHFKVMHHSLEFFGYCHTCQKL